MTTKREHGTVSSYTTGCRCELCRAAVAAYMRDWRARRGPRKQGAAWLDRLKAAGMSDLEIELALLKLEIAWREAHGA
jgi:hypothetical protein